MADTVQMNLNVQRVTKDRVLEMAKLTHRNPGQTLDWVVAEAWQRMQEIHRPVTTIEQVLAGAQTAPPTE